MSPAWVVSELGDPATSNDSFDYVAVNLLYWLIDRRAWVGGEYLYRTPGAATAPTSVRQPHPAGDMLQHLTDTYV